MTLVLLDTNAYLRLAKRISPMLGVPFGQKSYALTILKDVEEEVHRSPKLQAKFPWFDAAPVVAERLAKQVRLSATERAELEAATSVLHGWVLSDMQSYMTNGRSPPSKTDCFILAFGQIRPAIVVTDDLGMHKLAEDFGIVVWHGYELLSKMLSAKKLTKEDVREIIEAIERNGDATGTWLAAKHTTFVKIFGPPK
ncbi:hypothetical protein [Undibacterium terreum]|uniref:PIN domain-containing protein n=1 Tax=Undibacterium terreum TaxID=1224302 RepID=A0A916XLT9_9BURK|nr:hypothetical protein [Undibacterium terreum]GGC84696.1 hypothetical protein GCM10011396_35020 [Undibacterium terreum]